MAEEEYLVVSLQHNNSEYTAIVEEKKTNLHIGHLNNVLNYFGGNRWILEQINANETELRFSRKKMSWFKRLFEPKIKYWIRNIYEEDGKYEVGADLPFGEISSFEGLYLGSIEEVIEYFSSKYKMTLLSKNLKEREGYNLIKLYFQMSQ